MVRIAKVMRRALIVLLCLLLLVGLALALLGPLANSGLVQARVRGYLDQTFESRLAFRRIHVALLPRPHVILYDGRYSEPDRFSLQADTLALYPKIGPLLQGRPQIDVVSIDTPTLVLRLSDPTGAPAAQPADHERPLTQSAAVLAGFSRYLGDGRLFFNSARVKILRGEKRLGLSLIEGQVAAHLDKLEISTRGRSDVSEGFVLQAAVDPRALSISGSLVLEGVRPGGVADLFFQSRMPVEAAPNLSIDFSTRELRTWRLLLQSWNPSLVVKSGTRQVTLKEVLCRATIDLSPERIEASIDELRVGVPHIDLSGTLTRGTDFGGSSSPLLRVDLFGRTVDLGAVRESMLALMDRTPIVWKIIQGGTLSEIRLKATQPTLADLLKPDGFTVEARAGAGRLSIPYVALDLTEVAGKIAYENGVLTGHEASARYGATTGRSGQLGLRLTEQPIGMDLSLEINADVSQLPLVLKKAVRTPKFISELERINAVSGQATGHLNLSGPVNRLQVEVTAEQVSVQAEYERLPYPIVVSSGHLAYSGKRLTLSRIAGSVKSSSFDSVSGRVEWEGAPVIDLHQASLSLACDELYGWIKEDWVKDLPDLSIEAIDGRIDIGRLTLSGPAAVPRQWQFSADARLSNVTISSRKAAAPIMVSDGRLQVDRHRLALSEARVRLFDATLQGAATVSGYDTDQPLVEIGPVNGDIGEESMRRLGQYINLPERYRTQAPLHVDTARVDWNRPQGLSFDTSLVWLDQPFRLNGKVEPTAAAKRFDVTLSGSRLDLAVFESTFPSRAAPSGRETTDGATQPNRLDGRITVRVDRLAYYRHIVEPFEAVFNISDGNAAIDIVRADRCGIAITGRANWGAQGLELELRPQTQGQRLQYMGGCLSGTHSTERFEGELSIGGALRTHGRTIAELTAGLEGTLQLHVTNGRVTNVGGVGFFTNLLAFLKLNKLLTGTGPNFAEKDFPFHTLDAQLDVHGETITIKDGALRADAVNLAGEGTIESQSGKLSLTVLVSPLNTVDAVVRNIPIVGHILQGTLLAVPVGVSGHLSDPTIVPLSPVAIGARIWEILSRTIKTPLRLIEPLLPDSSGKNAVGRPSSNESAPQPRHELLETQ